MTDKSYQQFYTWFVCVYFHGETMHHMEDNSQNSKYILCFIWMPSPIDLEGNFRENVINLIDNVWSSRLLTETSEELNNITI
jgi:hypothetical protein